MPMKAPLQQAKGLFSDSLCLFLKDLLPFYCMRDELRA